MRLLIGTDSEQAAVIRIANEMHRTDSSKPLLVLIGSAGPFSFKPRPSTILVPGMLPGVIAAVPSLEEFGIASRLASEADCPELRRHGAGTSEGMAAGARSIAAGADDITVNGPEGLASSAEELGHQLGLSVRVTLPGFRKYRVRCRSRSRSQE